MKRNVKAFAARTLSLALCLVMSLTLLPAAALAADSGGAGSPESGSHSLPKLSKREIVDLLDAAPTALPRDIFVTEPSCTAPYRTGEVRPEVLDAAAARLSALRRLAGLPAVTADPALNEQAQYGAVILGKLGNLNHFPDKPADMDNNFYQTAYAATSSSNLNGGRGLLETPDGFMLDSDAKNITLVGHRRWQLNPQLGKVGFGYVDNGGGYQRFTVEKVFDRSGNTTDYDYVAWPASGNFPSNLNFFRNTTAWSVSLNPSRYRQPSASSVSVTLTRESDGKTWSFSGQNHYQPSDSERYFHIDTEYYGINNCIIFRPDGIDQYEGIYTVRIQGLQDSGGRAADLTYQVDFFSTKDVSSPADNVPTRGTAYANTQSVLLDGRSVEFQTYALKDSKGGVTNYVKLRDLAYCLNGTRAQFSVDWTAGQITLTSGQPYAPNGSELSTPFSGDRTYSVGKNSTVVGGAARNIASIVLTDDRGGAYTYYQLRDMGRNLGFNVSYINGQVVINTNEPYSDAQ